MQRHVELRADMDAVYREAERCSQWRRRVQVVVVGMREMAERWLGCTCVHVSRLKRAGSEGEWPGL